VKDAKRAKKSGSTSYAGQGCQKKKNGCQRQKNPNGMRNRMPGNGITNALGK
jgi:hypothetical protein